MVARAYSRMCWHGNVCSVTLNKADDIKKLQLREAANGKFDSFLKRAVPGRLRVMGGSRRDVVLRCYLTW